MILYEDDIERLEKIKVYIISNLHEDLKLKNLATKFHIEKHTLCRHFAQQYKLPLHQFIVNERLSKAYFLLSNKIMPVSEVALAVGYSDKSNFSHAFSARYRISPKELFKEEKVT